MKTFANGKHRELQKKKNPSIVGYQHDEMAANGLIQDNAFVMNVGWDGVAVHDHIQVSVDDGRLPVCSSELSSTYNVSTAVVDIDDGEKLGIQYAGDTPSLFGISSSNILWHGRLGEEFLYDLNTFTPCSHIVWGLRRSHHGEVFLPIGTASPPTEHPFVQRYEDPSYLDSHQLPSNYSMDGGAFPFRGNGPWGDANDGP